MLYSSFKARKTISSGTRSSYLLPDGVRRKPSTLSLVALIETFPDLKGD